jgi:hypothetical protein
MWGKKKTRLIRRRLHSLIPGVSVSSSQMTRRHETRSILSHSRQTRSREIQAMWQWGPFKIGDHPFNASHSELASSFRRKISRRLEKAILIFDGPGALAAVLIGSPAPAGSEQLQQQ